MKEDASSYLLSGILFLLTAIIFLFFRALGDKTGDLVAGGLFALTAFISFYQYGKKIKQEKK